MSMKNKSDDIIEKLKKNSVANNSSISEAVSVMTTVAPDNKDLIKHIKLDKLIVSPLEWNFYKPLSIEKQAELVESIQENGLINPIIVWEKEENMYMILAGHNRVNAFKNLFERTNDDKFSKIPTFVKSKDEITENEARAIIVDTNFVCRQLSTLERAKSILVKYNELGSKKRNEINIAEQIAAQFDIDKRQIYRYYQLNKLIPQFIDRIENGSLSMKAGLKIVKLRTGFQNVLFKELNDILNNKTIMKMDISATEDEIIKFLKRTGPQKLEKVVVDVPEEYVAEVINLIKDFLLEKSLR